MVDKLTPRLGLPEPFLTNPLKVDVGRLQQALEMIDSNAVMLTDWDIAADGWQKIGKIKGLAQGKVAASLMVVTGTGFANILFQTGDGSVTTVGDPARMTVSAQTNLGANTPTMLGGRVVETAADEYEIWFEIAVGTSPRKWSGLLIAGNGATIDWTHTVGAQPSGGVTVQISRSLTSFDVASETKTALGTLLTTGHIGAGVVQLDYLTTVDLKGRMWKTGELVRIKKADATDAKGFPPALVSADPSATGWFIRCLSINDTRTVKEFEFTSESAGVIRAYKARLSGTTWSVAKVYTSLDKPTANDINALGTRDPVTGTNVVNLNDMYSPDYYGTTAIKSTTSAVAANNYPFDEVGTVLVLPFGDTFSCTQLYVTQSGRVAARSYDGSTWTPWRKQANSGVNDDITSMTGLTGPLKLGGDGVGDYDAVTMRQLRSSSGGAGGPSMNGVMNYGVGDFHLRDSRAFIQPYEVVSDGQLLNRADWPELWAYAQRLSPIADADWLANPAKRGNYSLGNGTTTFRVPDRNGVQTGSIPGLYGRGDGGASSNNGTIQRSAAPNITANVSAAGTPNWQSPSGAFTLSGPTAPQTSGNTSTYSQTQLGIDASKSSTVYNSSVTEVRTNSFIGVWVIRASGGFVAAKTSWSVINGDTALPSNNTALKGGDLRSVYQINGVDHMAVTLRAAGLVGGNYAPEIEQVAPSGGSSITKKWTLPQAAGELVSKAETGYTSIEGKASGSVNGAYFTLQGSNDYVGMSSRNDHGDPSGTYFNGVMHGYPRGGLEIVNKRDGRYGYFLNLTFSRSNGTSTDHREPGLIINADGSTWMIAQPSFGSDIHLKSNITPLGKARDNLRTLRTVTFKMDGLDQMGLIAQDVAPHWPVAVSTFDKEHYEGDKLVKDGTFLSLNYTSMIAPAIKGINENSDILDAVVSALESALSDPEEAKVKLAALRKKFY